MFQRCTSLLRPPPSIPFRNNTCIIVRVLLLMYFFSPMVLLQKLHCVLDYDFNVHMLLDYREQVPFEEEDAMEEKQDIATHQESESSESDSEADKAEDTEMKEMFKEKTVDSLEDTVVKEEKIEPGTFGGFSFKKRNMNFKKPQIRQRINESDY